MAAQIVVVGGGVGGVVAANRLALLAPDDVQITLVDATGIHTYQQGWLYVPFGEVQPKQLTKTVEVSRLRQSSSGDKTGHEH